MTTKPANPQSSAPRAKSSARLHAVQAVYQMMVNDQAAEHVIDDFMVFRIGTSQDPEMPDLERPEGNLFRAIVSGVETHRANLEDEVGQHLKGATNLAGMKEKEPLLLSILLCGGYELMAHTDVDSPIIITDYLNVTHSYYQGKESSIINGILDQLKGLYRPK